MKRGVIFVFVLYTSTSAVQLPDALIDCHINQIPPASRALSDIGHTSFNDAISRQKEDHRTINDNRVQLPIIHRFAELKCLQKSNQLINNNGWKILDVQALSDRLQQLGDLITDEGIRYLKNKPVNVVYS